MIDLIFVALFQVVSGDPAAAPQDPQAQPQAPAAQEQQQQAQDSRNQRRCRTVAHTGSRIASTRVCMSQNEEEELRERTQHELREMRSRTITGTQGGGG